MTDNFDINKKLIPYKEIVKKKRELEYYYENKEAISQKRKEKYKQMPPDDKKSLLSKWFNRQSFKRREIKQKASIYHKNRYDNLMVRVR